MANLKLNHITKRFGKNVLAVKDISLEVHDGEFLVLLGPSGCGKTTTLRMIAGLEEVTKGRIIRNLGLSLIAKLLALTKSGITQKL